MSALRQPFPAIPSDEMARLHHAGFSLLPLGRGDDGKSPAVSFDGKPRFPLGRVLAPMHRTGSTCYGIRLDRLAVVDCDVDDPALVDQMEACFGASPVHVKTPRGRHLYYLAADSYPNLRAEGLPVDIKRGASSYVMGPGSVRPDGGAYLPAKGALGCDALPTLRSLAGPGLSKHIAAGTRHRDLTMRAIEMVEAVDDPHELMQNLRFIRDDECEDPASLSDKELEGIVKWAWQKRLEGQVWAGKRSAFRLRRDDKDLLRGKPGGSDAIALYAELIDHHGHVPGRTFPVDWSAMSAAGLTDLGRRRFRAARELLADVGLLAVASPAKAKKVKRTYRLARPVADAANVALINPRVGRGEGASLTYADRKRSNEIAGDHE